MMMNAQEKLVLSGGGISKKFLTSALELSGASNPKIVIDRSPRPDKKSFDESMAIMDDFLTRHGAPNYSWLQSSFDQTSSSQSEAAEQLDTADILFVMGGSTRQTYKRWHELGVMSRILDRVANGTMVGCGASAGAMIWFQKGYSDSRQYEVDPTKKWNYILVPGVSTVPAWVTAHYNDTDDLGRLRSKGFSEALKRNVGIWDVAIGLETCASLICSDGLARVIDIRGPKAEDPDTAYIFMAGEGYKPRAMQYDETIDLRLLN